jgi:hypothetical protein
MSIASQNYVFDFWFLVFAKFDFDFDLGFLVFPSLGGGAGAPLSKKWKSDTNSKFKFTDVGFWAAAAAKQRGATPANLQFWLIPSG